MRDEYDFKDGVRGKHALCSVCGKKLRLGTVTVPDENGELNKAAHWECAFPREEKV